MFVAAICTLAGAAFCDGSKSNCRHPIGQRLISVRGKERRFLVQVRPESCPHRSLTSQPRPSPGESDSLSKKKKLPSSSSHIAPGEAKSAGPPSRNLTGAASDKVQANDAAMPACTGPTYNRPGLGAQRLMAGWATVHLAIIAFSYFASISPSSFQSRLLGICRPYLSLLHQDSESMTLAIGRNLPAEKTHEMQAGAGRKNGELTWDADLPKFEASDAKPSFLSPSVDNQRGPAGGCRQRRWQRLLARLAELGEMDQAALAAWFMTPIVEQLPGAERLRIVRLPDLMTTVVDDNAASPYAVAMVRSEGTENLQLLQIPARRLVAPAVDPRDSSGAEVPAP